MLAVLLVGCAIDDLKVCEKGDVCGGKPGRTGAGGESGQPAADGGRGGRDAREAGKGGSAPAVGKGGSGGAGGRGGAAAGGKGGAGAGGTGGSAPDNSELISAFAHLAEVDCAKFAQCAPFTCNGQFADAQACKARRVLLPTWGASLPGLGWTPAKIAACRTVIDAQSCRQYMDDDGQADCLPPGTRQNGAPCNLRDQCASRFCSTNGYSCGMCAAAPAEGASCSEDVDCRDGTQCVCANGLDTCPARLCMRLRNDGEACGIGTRCGFGLNCLSDGRCHAAPNQPGAECSLADSEQCDVAAQGVICGGGDTCEKLVAADTCSATTYCRQRGSYCLDTGVCTVPTDTGSCAGGIFCLFPALCVNGNCQMPGAAPQCQ